MEKDLGSKKTNNEQEINEGFSTENLPDNYNPADAKLQSEQETDKDGNSKTVERARNPDSEKDNRNWNENESLSRDLSVKDEGKSVEHKDRNSDVAANRYPNAHPDNHQDRGNIKLDEE